MNETITRGGSITREEWVALYDDLKQTRFSCKLEFNAHEGMIVRDRTKMTMPAGIVFDIARKFGLMKKSS